jgi:hypothetical protein
MQRALRSLASGYSWARHHLSNSTITTRQRYIALGAAAGLAGLLAVGAAMPAGAKGEFVISAGGAVMNIQTGNIQTGVKLKTGPVTFTGAAQRAMPRFVSNVGHYAIGANPLNQISPEDLARDAQMQGAVVQGGRIVVPVVSYDCPNYVSGYSGYSYGGLAYGTAGYGVPLYDYRAKNTYFRPRANYGYGYDRTYGRRQIVQQQPREETLGTFNMPSGYTVLGLNETPRPSFEPRIVQLAGTPQHTGPMPVVHKPAGKNHIHIE